MNHPQISIISPVYNAEKYIHKCVDSIIAQTFTDWELILVDDGSPDASGAICDRYASLDSRIRVIHKQNGGVSAARQTGLDAARGEYVIHADPDDWVEPTMLEELYAKAKAEDADMVICDYYHNYTDGRETLMQQHPTRLNTPNQIDDIFFGGFFSSLCNKLIRRSVYNEYGIRFFPGVDYCEDVLVCVQIMKNSSVKTVFLPKAYYHYLMNDASITHNKTRRTFEALSLYRDRLNSILSEDKYEHIRIQVSLSVFVECFQQPGIMSDDEIKQYVKLLSPHLHDIVGLRYRCGFMFARLGLYYVARYFIHY